MRLQLNSDQGPARYILLDHGLVYDSVAKFGGSISAEHGVGGLKLDKLEQHKSPVALGMMRAIKRALDPLRAASSCPDASHVSPIFSQAIFFERLMGLGRFAEPCYYFETLIRIRINENSSWT
jgi:hypothetical protein